MHEQGASGRTGETGPSRGPQCGQQLGYSEAHAQQGSPLLDAVSSQQGLSSEEERALACRTGRLHPGPTRIYPA